MGEAKTAIVKVGFVALAFLAGALAFATLISDGAAATEKMAQVVLIKNGINLGAPGSDYAQYGLVLRNRSRTTDAFNIVVTVYGLDADGRAFTTARNSITLIPASTSFVIDGALVWSDSVDLARIRAVIRVGRAAPKRQKLPHVSNVILTDNGQDITASVSNGYRRSLPRSAALYAIFLDNRGRIVGAGDQATGAVLRPGQSVSVSLFGNLSMTEASSVTSVQVSVDPCGGTTSMAGCPIR